MIAGYFYSGSGAISDYFTILISNISSQELSSAFTTSLDSFFDDVTTGVDRIFSSENKNHSETKKNSKKNKKWYNCDLNHKQWY